MCFPQPRNTHIAETRGGVSDGTVPATAQLHPEPACAGLHASARPSATTTTTEFSEPVPYPAATATAIQLPDPAVPLWGPTAYYAERVGHDALTRKSAR